MLRHTSPPVTFPARRPYKYGRRDREKSFSTRTRFAMDASSSSSSRTEESTDIFPKYLSEKFEKLEYPPSFTLLSNDERFVPFIAYIRNYQMYYKKEETAVKYLRHLSDFDKNARSVDRFRPAEIDWSRIYRRYTAKFKESFKTNVDVKAGFKVGNQYLVKSFFTFGQRTVQPNTVHVYQILDVPLVLFVKPAKSYGLAVKEKYFPVEDHSKYDQMILPPNTTCRLAPGTTYFVMALQKTFFSLDIFSLDKCDVPSNAIDPVQKRIRKLPGMYDYPVETPFIDDLEEREHQPPVVDDKTDVMKEFFAEPLPPQVLIEPLPPQVLVEQPPPQVFVEQPPPPTRNIQFVWTPDIVKYYQSMTRRTYDDPNLFYCFENETSTSNDKPLDLTLKNSDRCPVSTTNQVVEKPMNCNFEMPHLEIPTNCVDEASMNTDQISTNQMPELDQIFTNQMSELDQIFTKNIVEIPPADVEMQETLVSDQFFDRPTDFELFDLDDIIYNPNVSDEIINMEKELMASCNAFM